MQRCVHAAVPVKRRTVAADELFSLDNVTLVPGEVYPEEGIHIIEVEAEGLLTSRSVLSMTALCKYVDNMLSPSALNVIPSLTLRFFIGCNAFSDFNLLAPEFYI